MAINGQNFPPRSIFKISSITFLRSCNFISRLFERSHKYSHKGIFSQKDKLFWLTISNFFCILVGGAGIYIKRYKARPHGANGVNGSFHSQNTQTKGCIKRQYFGSISIHSKSEKVCGFYFSVSKNLRKKCVNRCDKISRQMCVNQ